MVSLACARRLLGTPPRIMQLRGWAIAGSYAVAQQCPTAASVDIKLAVHGLGRDHSSRPANQSIHFFDNWLRSWLRSGHRAVELYSSSVQHPGCPLVARSVLPSPSCDQNTVADRCA